MLPIAGKVRDKILPVPKHSPVIIAMIPNFAASGNSFQPDQTKIVALSINRVEPVTPNQATALL